MDVNKEKWINEVMNSLDDVRSAEASPFLYNRILSKISKVEPSYAPVKLVWLAAASLTILALLNFSILRKTGFEKKERAEVEKLAEGYQLTNDNTLNYGH